MRPGRVEGGHRIGEFREPVLGTGVTVAAMLAGLAQHNACHGGQIARSSKRALAAQGERNRLTMARCGRRNPASGPRRQTCR
jgi:hypothetical protein